MNEIIHILIKIYLYIKIAYIYSIRKSIDFLFYNEYYCEINLSIIYSLIYQPVKIFPNY